MIYKVAPILVFALELRLLLCPFHSDFLKVYGVGTVLRLESTWACQIYLWNQILLLLLRFRFFSFFRLCLLLLLLLRLLGIAFSSSGVCERWLRVILFERPVSLSYLLLFRFIMFVQFNRFVSLLD